MLNFVDSAIKEAENQSRLAEIQRRLDTGPFDKVDHPIVSEFKVPTPLFFDYLKNILCSNDNYNQRRRK